MTEDLEPFGHVELEVLLESTAEKATAPAFAFAMGDGTTDGAAAGEEENVDVWVDLRDDGERDIELGIECAQGDVSAQGAVFPFMSKGEGDNGAVLGFRH